MRPPVHFFSFLVAIAIFLFSPPPAFADANGKQTNGDPYPCSSDKVGSILEVCKAVKSVLPFVQCPTLNAKCFRAQQEIFTGLSGEAASPTNIKSWNGQGVSGAGYQSIGLCLLRDLNDAPMTAHAEADLPIGKIQTDSVIDYMSFNKDTKSFTGSHRLTARMPVVGKVDIMTQVFSAKALDSKFAPGAASVGAYKVTGAHALEFEADAGQEGFDFKLQGLKIVTPYGTVEPQPYINLGRSSFWSLSPYGGANALTLNPGAFQTIDVYGRLEGKKRASALNPAKLIPQPPNAIAGRKFCGVIYKDKPHCLVPAPVGWNSQVMLGARNVTPGLKPWLAPPGAAFPLRPDSDPKTPRGAAEQLPNALAKAGVKIEYNILGLLPDVVKSNGFISIPESSVFADPNILVAFSSQFDFWNAQTSVWNPQRAKPPQPLVSPIDVESLHSMALFGGASVGGRYAVEAGVDLRINFHIDLCCWLDDIDFDIINIHPRTALLEETRGDMQKAARQAFVMTSAQAAVETGKPFQIYQTLKGGQTDGVQHVTRCFADPAPPAKTPPPPSYEKGDPKDLLKALDMQCNVCIGHADFTYLDGVEGQPGKYVAKTVKGFAQKLPFVSDAASPAAEKWTCGGPVAASGGKLLGVPAPDPAAAVTKAQVDAYNKAAQQNAVNAVKNLGCFDQCRVDPATGKFTKIVKSAKVLFAEGAIKGAPNGCY